jgi:magnesium chelatase family protein
MTGSVLRATCPLDPRAEQGLAHIVAHRPTMTARSIDRLIKVARTIADLDGEDAIDVPSLQLAASFRDVDPAADVLLQVA